VSGARRPALLIPAAAAILALCGFSGCGVTSDQPEPAAQGCPEHGWALLCPGLDRQHQSGAAADMQFKDRNARHEAAHAVVAKALGATVVSCRLNTDGSGKTRARGRVLHDPESRVAYELAGVVATGTEEGAEEDMAEVDTFLATIPEAERDRVRDAGLAEAARIVAEHSAEIDRDAVILLDRGWL